MEDVDRGLMERQIAASVRAAEALEKLAVLAERIAVAAEKTVEDMATAIGQLEDMRAHIAGVNGEPGLFDG